MRYAIALMRDSYPHPNPRVGALVVSPEGELLASGVCEADGAAHAEVNALADLPADLTTGATAVVTLEPCNHHGRTPPCTQALIDAGIARVVVGVEDPDPRVRGAGIARLKSAGIDVEVSSLGPEIEAADPHYYHHRRTGRPFVTLKLASTLDGQVAAADGTSQWITSPEARSDAHRLRASHDAVLVGAGTARIDDPLLNVRYDGYEGPQPRPVVLVGDEPLPADLALRDRDPFLVGDGEPGHPEIDDVLKRLSAEGVLGVLVEGGPTIAGAFIKAGAVDRLVWYLGAHLAGGSGTGAIAGTWETITDMHDLSLHTVTRIGGDVRIDADIKVGA